MTTQNLIEPLKDGTVVKILNSGYRPCKDRGVSRTARPEGGPHLPRPCPKEAPTRLHRSSGRPARGATGIVNYLSSYRS